MSCKTLRNCIPFLAIICLLAPVRAQDMPSTVSITQWQDSWLAKWQSDASEDKTDAITQLAALHLLTEGKTEESGELQAKLMAVKGSYTAVDAALAFQLLETGFQDQAAKELLDLILNYPDDARVVRFRIGLARAFIQDNQFDLAGAQLEPIVNPDTPSGQWALLEQARLLKASGETDLAINSYNELIKANTSNFLMQLANKELLNVTFNQVIQEEPIIE